MARSRFTEKERYWQKVDQCGAHECWEWTAATNRLGYGLFLAGGTCVLAHRYGWSLAAGRDPGELCVLHRCDNPPCQNPAHHFLGTRADNAADRNRKGRQAKGERSGASRLTEGDVRAAHSLYSRGSSVAVVAGALGVHKSTIEAMIHGRSWAHLGLRWETRPGRLNPDRVRAIRQRVGGGEDCAAVAADYGTTPKYVREIAARRSWVSVP